MSHQWTMEDFESIYSRFKSSGLSVMDFCSTLIPQHYNLTLFISS